MVSRNESERESGSDERIDRHFPRWHWEGKGQNHHALPVNSYVKLFCKLLLNQVTRFER